MLRSRRERLDRARDFLARRGGTAVFLGRFVAFFRAVMPALAGTAGMRYPKFLAFNAAGGIVWGVGFVLLGYLAGNSYAAVEPPRDGMRRSPWPASSWCSVVWRIRRHRGRAGCPRHSRRSDE